MRLIASIVALLFAVGPTAALDWMEYTYPDHSFSVAFPAAPNIEPASYRAADGRTYPARIYSVTQDSGVFKLTVVDVANAGTDDKALVDSAVETLTRGGQIKLDIPHRIRGTYGRQLSIAGADGSLTYVAAFYHNKRLYQLEGKSFVAGGQAEVDAMIFHQSLDLT